MDKAKESLLNYIITAFVVFVVFAVGGHIMFGAFERNYSTILRSFITVFDHLLNPFGLEQGLVEHNLEGSWMFFLVSTGLELLLLLSSSSHSSFNITFSPCFSSCCIAWLCSPNILR